MEKNDYNKKQSVLHFKNKSVIYEDAKAEMEKASFKVLIDVMNDEEIISFIGEVFNFEGECIELKSIRKTEETINTTTYPVIEIIGGDGEKYDFCDIDVFDKKYIAEIVLEKKTWI